MSSFKDKTTNTAASAYAAKETAKDAVNDTVASLRSVETNVRDTAERLGREARDYVDTAVTSAKEVSTQVKDRIENQPLQSTLIALGAGFLIGFLLKSSK
jgi:ElaB/YqjD/DUF883 family membrane-anchored ribosome-binding protein